MTATVWVAGVATACCCVALGWVMGRLSADQRMIKEVFSRHMPSVRDPNYWARAHQYDLMWLAFQRNSRLVPADFDEYMRRETRGTL